MKLSYHWLKQFVDLKGITAEAVGEKLTLHTAELEEIIDKSKNFEQVFAGQLISTTPHADSDKLQIGQFDLGARGKKQIIYADKHPVEVGEILPLALDGARLASGINIKDTTIRGEKSEGMVTDNTELGLKNEGLLRFSDKKSIGKSLPEIISMSGDQLFDIDNKSLTHRPDLMGHQGFALELSAIFDRALTCPEPVVRLPKSDKKIGVDIQSPHCRRFCTLQIDQVGIKPSPLETQFLLENLGTRAINNVVDTTNLIMLEFGQPMHAFDAEKISGDIIVRQAKSGEKLMALDGEEYKLTTDDIVIADQEKVLSIAGIMGGLESAVTEETTKIIFECANFDPTIIRKTSKRIGLRSESSMRYEKSLDPNNLKRAILGATEKVLENCPQAQITTILTDEYPQRPEALTIDLDPNLVRQHSGLELTDAEIIKKLESLNFAVKAQDKTLEVGVPSNRATKDVTLPEDLIEEVVRLHGFTNIPSELPTLPITPPRTNHLRQLEWKSRDFWAHHGFLEVYNYSFINAAEEKFSHESQRVEIQNPLSSEHQFLRTNLIAPFVRDCESELRQKHQLSFFEIGRSYHPTADTLPVEKNHLVVFEASLEKSEDELFFETKTTLTTYLQSLGQDIQFVPSQNPPTYAHPHKCAEVTVNGKVVGHIATLHPSQQPVKGSAIAFVDLDLDILTELHATQHFTYRKLSNYPAVHRDLSIVCDKRTLVSDIEKCIYQQADLVEKIELFDEFTNAGKLGKDVKNYAFHLTFRSPEKTLQESDIEIQLTAVIKILESELQAQLRSEFDKSSIL
jgi:phenylalanyl-tRNA synthetase beta chain